MTVVDEWWFRDTLAINGSQVQMDQQDGPMQLGTGSTTATLHST
jgi:hypothetical protein